MKKIKNSVFMIVVLAMSQSCATLFTPSSQMITIETEGVDGVKVYDANGSKLGKTPLKVNIKKQLSAPMLTLKKEGYETKRVVLSNSIHPVSFINLISIIAWAIDLGTGKAMRYAPVYYNYEMEEDK